MLIFVPAVYSVFVADKTPVLESIDKLLPSIFTPPRVPLLAIGNVKSTTSTYSKPSLTSVFNLMY